MFNDCLMFFLDDILHSIFLLFSLRNSNLGLLDCSYNVLIYSRLFSNFFSLVSFFQVSLLGDFHDFFSLSIELSSVYLKFF